VPLLINDVQTESGEAVSERVKAGLGVIPRTVGDNIVIHNRRISLKDAQLRIGEVHTPWHQTIEACLAQATLQNGAAVLVDCHSMPSNASGDPSYDIVLGDRFGASCAPIIMNEAMIFLRAEGLSVARNNPYAGGYSTARHGKPLLGHHALQIEINRALYMVEGAMTLRQNSDHIRKIMAGLIYHLGGVSEKLGKGSRPQETILVDGLKS
jgi:N-formylglutamate amidohydrolase